MVKWKNFICTLLFTFLLALMMLLDVQAGLSQDIEIPQIISVEDTGMSIKVEWTAIEGVEGYKLYREVNREGSELLADITDASVTVYEDIDIKYAHYQYYVYAYQGDDRSLDSDYVTIVRLATPNITEISNTQEGIKIQWNKSIKNAQGYYVERRTEDSEYEQIDLIEGGEKKTYTDKTSEEGTLYYYRVKAFCDSGKGDYSNEVMMKRLAHPKNLTAENVIGGIRVGWKAKTGATGYYISRKAKDGSWIVIGSVDEVDDKDIITYLDKTAESGVLYYYRASAFDGEFVSAYTSNPVSMKRLVRPSITTANVINGTRVTWKKIKGAEGYVVERKVSSNGKWKEVKRIDGSSTVKFTDTDVSNGKTYYYRVQAFYGSFESLKSTIKNVKCLKRPTISLSKSSSKLKVKWNKNSYCAGYQIYYATDSEFSKNLKKTTCTSKTTVSKTLSNVKKGKTYYVKVRSYYKVDDIKRYSAWSSVKKIKM